MPTYIGLCKYTQKGIEAVKDSANRHDAQQAAFRSIGVRITDQFLTMGRYDLINVMEAPDNMTMERMALTINSWGWIHVEVMPAFSREEYRQLVASVP
jgi:uncharacterized protein with GYD domain